MKFQKVLMAGAALLAISTAPMVAHAQQTTSSLGGDIVDAAGSPISGASITITHTPTGSRTTLAPGANGKFFASGLRPGGPYSVRVDAEGFQAEEVQGIFLALDQTVSVRIDLDSTDDEARLDVVVVTAQQTNLETIASGVGTTFGAGDLSQLPTATRDPKEIVRLDPRAVVTEGASPELSIAGLNQRFNSITIDGIRLNDDFGLNRSGNPGRSNPVSIDAIDQIVVNVADYDVEASQYLGGNVNIITKSGTNDLSGSAYIFSRNDSFAGDLPNGNEPVLNDTTYGFTLGGPIIKDRLFFFANYEKFESDFPVISTPEDAGITDAEISQFQTILQDVYGFDGGTVQLSNPTDDERILLKLDANITDGHRAVLTYTSDKARTSDQQESNTGNFALSTTYRTRDRDIEGISAQLFSDWTDNFSTELVYSNKEAIEDRNPNNQEFAQFLVQTGSGSFLHAGPRFPFQQNFQRNVYETFKAKGVYEWGDHVIKGGYEYQSIDIRNDFILFAPNGYYVFNDFTDLQNRVASNFMFENSPTGNPDDASAVWGYDIHNLFLQDTWQYNEDLTLDFGVRIESYSASESPDENPGFVARNGFSNTENLDGKSLFMPRLGLTWTPTDRTTVRAGAGLFSGGTPNVFYSNTFSRNGVATATVGVFRQPCSNLSPADALAICTNVDGFNVAPEAQALVEANAGSGTAEALDPDFNIPSSWKLSAGIEHEWDLSAYGLGDGWRTKADALYIMPNDALTVNILGLQQSGTTFDGRPTFNVGTRDFLLTNTDEGDATSLSFLVQKEFDTGWDVFLGYTRTDSNDADSTIGSVLADTTRLVGTDINNLPATTSAFEVQDRFIFGANYEHKWFDEYATRIGLFGEHRSGLPFSYTFANNPFGSQASAPFYVPLANDPNVNYAAGTQAALDSFIADNGLEGYRGQILPRNGFRGEDVTKVDLRFAQELPGVWSGSKTEFIFDIDNFTNLLNSDWGIERTVSNNGTFGATAIPLASVAYDDVTNTYTYSGTPGAGPSDDARIVDSLSFWSIQMGFRISF